MVDITIPCTETLFEGMRERGFTCTTQGRSVPVAVWLPAALSAPERCPLVLVGHGGTGHKRADIVLNLARILVKAHGFVVAAIDGPVHGDRRRAPATPEAVRDEFRVLWAQGDSVAAMAADWNAALAHLTTFPEVDAARVGYYGLSMGTAYGLPFLAQQDNVHAAVLGMWGTSRVNSQRLLQDAARLRAPTLFAIQWHDELFTRQGQFELFDAIAATDKRMTIHPGRHINPDTRRLAEIAWFLQRYVSSPCTAAGV